MHLILKSEYKTNFPRGQQTSIFLKGITGSLMLNAISSKIKNYTCSRNITKSRQTSAKFYRNMVKTERTNNKVFWEF